MNSTVLLEKQQEQSIRHVTLSLSLGLGRVSNPPLPDPALLFLSLLFDSFITMTIFTIVLIVATVACLCFLSANADYDKKGPVEILTEKTFQSVLMKSFEAWLVEFYAPVCI